MLMQFICKNKQTKKQKELCNALFFPGDPKALINPKSLGFQIHTQSQGRPLTSKKLIIRLLGIALIKSLGFSIPLVT